MKVYYFTAPWCQPCKRFGPIMESVKEKLADVVEIIRIDIEQTPTAATVFDVQSIPTVLIAEGGNEISRFMGAKDEGFVLGFIAPHIVERLEDEEEHA